MLLPLLLTLATAAGFEKNLGQTDPQVRYLLRSRDVSVFLTDRETVFRTSSGSSVFMESTGKPVADSVASSTITSFVGPRERWREAVPVFERIRRRDVFPGIDLVHYGAEYDYVVAPGANPRAIAVRFRGQKSLRIDETGALVFDNDLRHKRPVAYQVDEAGRKCSVESWFQLLGDVVTLGVGNYDNSRELVIDPEFEALRFYGGAEDDEVSGGATATVTTTSSIDYPFTYNAPRSGTDILVSVGGRQVYFGGSGDERPTGVFLVSGGAIVAGETTSRDLPVTASFTVFPESGPVPEVRNTYAGGETDGFLLSVQYGITRPAFAMISSGYIGGSGCDRVVGVTDSFVFVGTDSTDLPVTMGGPFAAGPAANYALRLRTPFASGYFGGAPVTASLERNGVVTAAAADGGLWTIGKDAIVRGDQVVPGGGPVRALRPSVSGWGLIAASDRALVRLNPDTLAVEGVYPIPASSRVHDVLLHQNYALIAGQAGEQEYSPTRGDPPQADYGGGASDGFLAAIDLSNGTTPFWTYLGGTGDDAATGITKHANGSIRVIGRTTAAWAGGMSYGGVDIFDATLRLPLMPDANVPQWLGKDLAKPVELPPGVSITSSNEAQLRITRSGPQILLESLAASGTSQLRVTGEGLWPAVFRVRHFEPGIEFVLQVPDPKIVVQPPIGVGYANVRFGVAPDGTVAELARMGAMPRTFHIRLANPGLGDVRNPEVTFFRAGSRDVWIDGKPDARGVTELVVEPASPGKTSSLPVEVVPYLPEVAGTQGCTVARGFSVVNRAPVPNRTGDPVALRSQVPGELLFASDIDSPRFANEITVPADSAIRIAARFNAGSRPGVVYGQPGADDAQAMIGGCSVANAASSLADDVSTLSLRNGPKKTRLSAFFFGGWGQPLPLAYVQGAKVTSKNPEILDVEMGSDWEVTLFPKATGVATLRLETPNAYPVDLAAQVLDGAPLVAPADVSVGKDLQVKVTLQAGLDGPLTIESADPTRALVASDSTVAGSGRIQLAPGAAEFWVQALEGSGVIPIRVSGAGYSPTRFRAALYPSTVGVVPLAGTIYSAVGLDGPISVSYLALFERLQSVPSAVLLVPAVPQLLRPGAAPARVRLLIDNPTIATVTPADFVLTGQNATVQLRVRQAGETLLRIRVEDFLSLQRIGEVRLQVEPR